MMRATIVATYSARRTYVCQEMWYSRPAAAMEDNATASTPDRKASSATLRRAARDAQMIRLVTMTGDTRVSIAYTNSELYR